MGTIIDQTNKDRDFDILSVLGSMIGNDRQREAARAKLEGELAVKRNIGQNINITNVNAANQAALDAAANIIVGRLGVSIDQAKQIATTNAARLEHYKSITRPTDPNVRMDVGIDGSPEYATYDELQAMIKQYSNPETPVWIKPTTFPTADLKTLDSARRTSAAQAGARGGRSSTILSQG